MSANIRWGKMSNIARDAFFCREEVGEVSSSKNWCRDDMHAKLYIWPHEISIKSSETYELPQTHNSLAAPATSSNEEERSHLTRIWISNSGPQIFCVWAKDFFMSDPQIFFLCLIYLSVNLTFHSYIHPYVFRKYKQKCERGLQVIERSCTFSRPVWEQLTWMIYIDWQYWI